MQLTRFDRWLREKFVHETHIHTMRPVDRPPAGVRESTPAAKPGRQFRHRYITRSSKAADELVRTLRQNNMMFTTRIVDRRGWHVRFIAPEARSPTWWLISFTLTMLFTASLVFLGHRLWSDPEIRQNILESLHIIRQ